MHQEEEIACLSTKPGDREFYYVSQSKTWYDNTARNTWAELVSNTKETAVLLTGRHLQILPSPCSSWLYNP